MYPAEFDYHRADSVEHALELLAEHDDELPELLSGGHSLLPMMKSGLSRPPVVIDVGQIDELHGIDVGEDTTTIGATTTYAEIADHDGVREALPALADVTAAVGDMQVRNRGTIGGNLAHADPAADPPGAALALEATVVAQGPDGRRRIDAEDYFFGMYTTDLEESELLVAVEFENHDPDTQSAYVKTADPASGYATIGVAAVVTTDDGTVETARVAANGAMDYPIRLDAVEDALEGESFDEETITAAATHAGEGLDVEMMMEDEAASAEYRLQLLEIDTEDVLLDVLERSA